MSSSSLTLTQPLSLVFGGCCTNAWSLEQLLTQDAHLGSALTLIQMTFIVAQSLPAVFDSKNWMLKPRAVPLTSWVLQVGVLTAMSLLNGWVFLFPVPVSVQIVFRSAALVVSMVFNFVFNGKRYTPLQLVSVVVVTGGVVLATLSRPSTSSTATALDPWSYMTGIAILSLSLLMAGTLGILQERTFTQYGPHWREGLFYTHIMSLPLVASTPGIAKSLLLLRDADPRTVLLILAINVVTQSICVVGVNQLMSRVSSVSTNIVLTTRKAMSLCISVWYFGAGWNAELALGAGLVGIGTILYAFASRPAPPKDEKIKTD